MNESEELRRQWDERYRANGAAMPEAARVLSEYRHLLPATGRALDLACGLGGNALLLAEAGLETWAWDLSAVAVARLAELAAARALPIHVEQRDVIACPPPPQSFDVITVSRFLERALAPVLSQALRPGGLLFYQTFTKARLGEGGPRNPAYLLDDNELLALFSGLRVRAYREEGLVGDLGRGWRGEALLVAQKPEVGA
ncbi:MAG TPA: class I SAM-dependent methyltransferase [Candidatus Competibacteraceae bacterium]|nr:class I SAM-dependent methyltransferase [Candidatus Competibacteraceae bacterium]